MSTCTVHVSTMNAILIMCIDNVCVCTLGVLSQQCTEHVNYVRQYRIHSSLLRNVMMTTWKGHTLCLLSPAAAQLMKR